MSTKLFDAWRVQKTEISALAEIGRKIQEFHTWEHKQDELMGSIQYLVAACPELRALGKAFKEHDPNFGHIAYLGERVTRVLLDMNDSNATWVATAMDKAFASWYISTMLEKDRSLACLKEVPDAVWNQFQELVIHTFERLNQHGRAQLLFIQGEPGFTYIKGFGLTDAARKYLNETYENFEYTDQTEMGPEFFSKEVQQAAAAMSEEAAYEFLWREQEKRGKLWDAVFSNSWSLSNAGLCFTLDPADHPLHQFYKAVLEGFEKTEE